MFFKSEKNVKYVFSNTAHMRNPVCELYHRITFTDNYVTSIAKSTTPSRPARAPRRRLELS